MLGDTAGSTGVNDHAFQLTKPVLGQVKSRPGLDINLHLKVKPIIWGTTLGEALRMEMTKLSHLKLAYKEGLGPPLRGSVWRIGGVPFRKEENLAFKCVGAVWHALVEIKVIDIDAMKKNPLYKDVYATWQRWNQDNAPPAFKGHGYPPGTLNTKKNGVGDALSMIGTGYNVPMKEVLPGDILQTAHGQDEGHCAVVWEIERDENGLPNEMQIISANVNSERVRTTTKWIESKDNAIKIQTWSDNLKLWLTGTRTLEGKSWAVWVPASCERGQPPSTA